MVYRDFQIVTLVRVLCDGRRMREQIRRRHRFIAVVVFAGKIRYNTCGRIHRLLARVCLPDYLGLYALLALLSACVEDRLKNVFAYWRVDIRNVTSVLSEIFALSHNSIKLVASAMTIFFAVYSL